MIFHKKTVIVIFLLLLPLVHGKVLHDSWHNSGDTFTAGGISYELFHEFEDDKVFFSTNGTSFIVREGRCEDRLAREHCVTEIDNDINGSKVTYSDGKALAGLKIKVEEAKPTVKLSRTFSKTKLEKGEKATITVTIENTGNRPVDKYVYRDSFPPDLGLESGDDEVYKTGSVKIGDKRSFSYVIEAKEFVEFVSQGNLTYTYSGSEALMKTNSQAITVSAPYDVETILEDDSLKVGEETSFELMIKPEETVNATMEVDFGDLKAVPSTNLTKIGNMFTWGGTLSENEDFEWKISSSKSGNYSIDVYVKINTADESGTFTESKILQVERDELVPNLEVYPNPVDSGSTTRVRLLLENPSSVQLEAEGTVTIFEDEEPFDVFVQAGETVVAVEKNVKAPRVYEETSFPVSFEGTFTNGEETFEISKESEVKVNPIPIDLSLDLDAPESVEKGEKLSFTVSVSSGEPLNVTINGTYSGQIINESVSLEAGGKESFTYSLTSQEDVEISVAAEALGVEVSQNAVVTVKEKEQTVNKFPTKEETGFFTSTVNKIKGFFVWIFN